MAFTPLSENQEHAVSTLEAAVMTLQRAELSLMLADERLYFLELTRALFHGDPWFLDQVPVVQAELRAIQAEDEGLERRRKADALAWLEKSAAMIDSSFATLEST